MKHKEIIAEAWHYTQSNKRLIFWFGLIPSILTTVVGIAYVTYQFFSFRNSYLFSGGEQSFAFEFLATVYEFLKSNLSLTVPIIVFLTIFVITYLLFPTLAKASAIQIIAREKNQQSAGITTGFQYGLKAFLPLFEYHLLIKTFAFYTILSEMGLVLRNMPGLVPILFPLLIFVMFIGLFLTLL